jgi:heme/copper-type cytochrome/quinol oxidase subunit 2
MSFFNLKFNTFTFFNFASDEAEGFADQFLPRDFQFPGTEAANHMISLHSYILIYGIGIIAFVFAFLLYTSYYFKSQPAYNLETILRREFKLITRKFKNDSRLERDWTLFPALVLTSIAFPSVELLYFFEQLVDPALTIKAGGRQWYWNYSYPDKMETDYTSYFQEFCEKRLEAMREGHPDIIVPVNYQELFRLAAQSYYTDPGLGLIVAGRGGQIFDSYHLPFNDDQVLRKGFRELLAYHPEWQYETLKDCFDTEVQFSVFDAPFGERNVRFYAERLPLNCDGDECRNFEVIDEISTSELLDPGFSYLHFIGPQIFSTYEHLFMQWHHWANEVILYYYHRDDLFPLYVDWEQTGGLPAKDDEVCLLTDGPQTISNLRYEDTVFSSLAVVRDKLQFLAFFESAVPNYELFRHFVRNLASSSSSLVNAGVDSNGIKVKLDLYELGFDDSELLRFIESTNFASETSSFLNFNESRLQWFQKSVFADFVYKIKVSPYLKVIVKEPVISFDSYMKATTALDLGDPRLLKTDKPMVVPDGVQVRIVVTSQDVLHSFAVPTAGIKIDAVPGRLNQIGVKFLFPGRQFGQCSELCGVYHGFMPIEINVVDPREFLDWAFNKMFEFEIAYPDLVRVSENGYMILEDDSDVTDLAVRHLVNDFSTLRLSTQHGIWEPLSNVYATLSKRSVADVEREVFAEDLTSVHFDFFVKEPETSRLFSVPVSSKVEN